MSEEPPRPETSRRGVVGALLLVSALVSLESTIVSTAMPTIIGELSGIRSYSWVAAIYLLASTLTMPLYGRLADVHGRRRVLLFATALFVLGSLACAAARSMPHLIAARGLQGLGAGGVAPIAMTVAADLFNLAERARVQALFSAVWGTSSVLGPLLGAGLTMGLGWRSIFLVNVPLGALALGLVARNLGETRGADRRPPDLLGALRLAGRAATAPYVSAFVLGVLVYSVDTFVPLFVQGARGGTAGAAGAVITPVILLWAASAAVAARGAVTLGFRRVATAGGLVLVGGLLALAIATRVDAPVVAVSLVCAVVGCGFGPTSMSQMLAVQHAAPESVRGVATSLVPFFRTAGGALGVALLGGVLARGLDARLGPSAADAGRLLAGDVAGLRAGLSAEAFRRALEGALFPVFLVLVGVAAIAVLAASRYPERA